MGGPGKRGPRDEAGQRGLLCELAVSTCQAVIVPRSPGLSAGLGLLPCSSRLYNGSDNRLSIKCDSVSP